MNPGMHCIGIIPDGNRRWAKARGKQPFEGHRQGYDRLIDCARWVRDRGIPHMAVYAFSTENWNRSRDEVEYLMNLFLSLADHDAESFTKERIRLRFIGKREMLSEQMRAAIARAESLEGPAQLTIWICLSYGGRAEITAAAQSLVQEGIEITEKSLRAHLWGRDMPDPDAIVRTGGEQRLSNFLMWQSAYSELFFVDAFWPDFSESTLETVLEEFADRKRNFGI